MDRLPELEPDQMNEAQRRIYGDITSGPRGKIRGPFPWLLRSPGLADRAQKLGAYLRFDSSLPGNQRELAILVVARFWRAQFEWYAHAPLARNEGVADAVIDALADNRRPDFTDTAEAAIYGFCTGMLNDHEVDDATYGAAFEALGEEGLLDVIGIMGYYSLLAMIMDTFNVPIPDDASPLQP